MAGETLELNFTIQNPNAGIKNCFIFGSNVTNRANLNQVTITPDFGVSYEQTLVGKSECECSFSKHIRRYC